MTRVRVSVCALRTRDDALAVRAGGADAAGVLVLTTHRAEDALPVEDAADVLSSVPPYIDRYAVTHAVELDRLLMLADHLPIATLQLHDDVAPATVQKLRNLRPTLRLIKAIHVSNGGLAEFHQWDELVDALVVDSVNPDEDRIGGTGLTHDWRISADVVKNSKVPVVLAGGLTPSNVGEAVAFVKPWAVNVNSGVERDGYKDAALISALVNAANGRGAVTLRDETDTAV